jgi:hypothetical protein
VYGTRIAPDGWGDSEETMTKSLTYRDAKQLLEKGKPGKAFSLIQSQADHGPETKNLMGVALLRLGRASEAARLFENLVFHGDRVSRRANVPDLVVTNLATALLMSGDVRGCLRVLKNLKNPGSGPAARLRIAIQRWWKGLGLWHRLRWYLGGTSLPSVKLDFPPGDIDGPRRGVQPPRAA